MTILRGTSAFEGICIGRLFYYNKKFPQRNIQIPVTDTKIESSRFLEARNQAAAELEQLYQKALVSSGKKEAAIFQAHRVLIEDSEYFNTVIRRIEEKKISAECAAEEAAEHFIEIFSSIDNPYMKERAIDIRDVTDRIFGFLTGNKKEWKLPEEPVILAAETLTPSETISLKPGRVLGFVTGIGSTNSHTAILARAMGLPAVVGIGTGRLEPFDGILCAIDGFTGNVYFNPEEEILQELQEKQKQAEKEEKLLKDMKGKKSITLDGKELIVAANMGNVEELPQVLKNDAEGIGLFRSEFLYLGRRTSPDEEEQTKAYRKVVQAMQGKEVIIRTLDLGADKQAEYLDLEPEENPALGLRAIRLCLVREELFQTQLRALLRASAYGNLSILFPMIISVEEVQECKRLVAEAKKELDRRGQAYKKDLKLGIMIETPAAVWISEELAKEVDFFSVGTNDLIQYTLALDRQNPKLNRFFNPHHPAILRMLETVAKNALAAGIRAGICGELGADLTLTGKLVRMGYEEFSVVPGKVLAVRKKIRESYAAENTEM